MISSKKFPESLSYWSTADTFMEQKKTFGHPNLISIWFSLKTGISESGLVRLSRLDMDVDVPMRKKMFMYQIIRNTINDSDTFGQVLCRTGKKNYFIYAGFSVIWSFFFFIFWYFSNVKYVQKLNTCKNLSAVQYKKNSY